jgi:hypothetical protein
MAFLEIITRTFGGRPAMLNRCLASVAQQIDRDYTHTIVMDPQARGVPWAVGNLATVQASGTYVWVLDDDDVCVCPTLVTDLKLLASAVDPDVVMVRTNHAQFGTLPHQVNWMREPQCGDIGTSNYIVHGDTWNAYRHLWRAAYEGDYWFIHDLWQMGHLSWYWHDVIVAHYPQQSQGAAYAS